MEGVLIEVGKLVKWLAECDWKMGSEKGFIDAIIACKPTPDPVFSVDCVSGDRKIHFGQII